MGKQAGIGEVGQGVAWKADQNFRLRALALQAISWAAGEQKGGWLFNATATRSIRTSITG
jgi:hypothetical protein